MTAVTIISKTSKGIAISRSNMDQLFLNHRFSLEKLCLNIVSKMFFFFFSMFSLAEISLNSLETEFSTEIAHCCTTHFRLGESYPGEIFYNGLFSFLAPP